MLAIASSALAFNAAPVAPVATRAAVRMAFEAEINPGPQKVFDPLGLLKNADQDRFDRLRFVEIKHGRIAMLAVLGHIVTSAGVRLPGDLAAGVPFASMPTGLKALKAMPPMGLLQITLFIGFLELYVMKDLGGNDFVGDFRNGTPDFGWDKFTDKQKEAKRGIELNNGRAAMMGILGLMVHEKINNSPYVVNELIGSPVPFNVGF